MINFLSEPLFAGFALKLILNAISTGANILKGKVFRNTMINLTVANDKVSFNVGMTLRVHVHQLICTHL